MSEEKLNILQRINKIKKDVAYIKKDAKVEGYKAVTHDQVTALTRDAFISHGVVILTTEMESKLVPVGTATAKGKPWVRFEAKYTVSFFNEDDPKDFCFLVLTSHAEDYGDKAPGKAISYAVKTAILKILQIETGVNDEGRDAEAHNKSAPVKLITEEQVNELHARASEGDVLDRFYTWLKSTLNITNMNDIKARDYTLVSNTLSGAIKLKEGDK